jgi:hypothetical protein
MRNTSHVIGTIRVLLLGVSAFMGAAGAALAADVLVSVGSPEIPFSRNKQNEPALAVDAAHPRVLAAGANDNIDM